MADLDQETNRREPVIDLEHHPQRVPSSSPGVRRGARGEHQGVRRARGFRRPRPPVSSPSGNPSAPKVTEENNGAGSWSSGPSGGWPVGAKAPVISESRDVATSGNVVEIVNDRNRLLPVDGMRPAPGAGPDSAGRVAGVGI